MGWYSVYLEGKRELETLKKELWGLRPDDKQELGSYFKHLKNFGVDFDTEDLALAVTNKLGTETVNNIKEFEEEFRTIYQVCPLDILIRKNSLGPIGLHGQGAMVN